MPYRGSLDFLIYQNKYLRVRKAMTEMFQCTTRVCLINEIQEHVTNPRLVALRDCTNGVTFVAAFNSYLYFDKYFSISAHSDSEVDIYS